MSGRSRSCVARCLRQGRTVRLTGRRASLPRALAALLPQELEPKSEHEPIEPSIVVYDLPAGAAPVLHRPPAEPTADIAPNRDEAPSQQQPRPSNSYSFYYEPPDGAIVLIGSWTPPDAANSGFATFYYAPDLETATSWRAELSAGNLPNDDTPTKPAPSN
jgi:hypothetical protein